jgi:hypothetical protein
MSMLKKSKSGSLIRTQDESDVRPSRACLQIEICSIRIVMPCPETSCSLRQNSAVVLVGDLPGTVRRLL